MPQRFVESITGAAAYLLLIVCAASLIPFPANMLSVEPLLSIFVATPVYALLLCFYLRIRNQRFVNKESEFLVKNDYYAALAMIEKAITRQPRLLWLKNEKAIVLGLAGELDSFYPLYDSLLKQGSFSKQFNHLNLIIVHDTIDFLRGELNEESFCYPQEKDIEKTAWPSYYDLYRAACAYGANDYFEALKAVEKMASSRSNFFRFFALFIQFHCYEVLGELELAKLHKKQYAQNLLAGKLAVLKAEKRFR